MPTLRQLFDKLSDDHLPAVAALMGTTADELASAIDDEPALRDEPVWLRALIVEDLDLHLRAIARAADLDPDEFTLAEIESAVRRARSRASKSGYREHSVALNEIEHILLREGEAPSTPYPDGADPRFVVERVGAIVDALQAAADALAVARGGRKMADGGKS